METVSESRFVTFLKEIKKTTFTTQDLQNALGFKSFNSRNVALHRFLKKGWLVSLGRGIYSNSLQPPQKFEAATALVCPSYVSFESALNHYGILSQIPQIITMATTKKSREISLLDQTIKYIHLKPDLFWGYLKIGETLMAEPEKALLDTLYLKSKGLTGLTLDELDLGTIDQKKLQGFARAFPKLCLPKLKFKN